MSSSLDPSALAPTSAFPLAHSLHTPPTAVPAIGYGVYLAGGASSVLTALALGYRHIDTAQLYENESEVGAAVQRSGIPRSELFITTKIGGPVDNSVEKTLESLRDSVRKSTGAKGRWEGGEGYVDLFLVHNPLSGPEGRKVLWTALERLQEEGGTKEIGVSNYGIKHLEELLTYCRHPPVANQLELHPFCPQPAVVNFCRSKNILLQAYTPLIRGRKMDDPVLVSIANAHNVTVAQVLVRWSLQMGFNPLPKSDDPARMRKNKDVFGWELSEEEMRRIEELGKGLEDGQGAVCPYLAHVP
ncbi:NADP-dependent oxidoreductase domain-containing protein [Kalaharituber pfeilii]|nr:NADP-dependent oxidoreductase domain-containing protein [Kalaharituber pfeilii]